MKASRRDFLASGLSLAVAGCASTAPAPTSEYPPIVFVHGNGDSASVWMTTIWRFESNGWPRERLHAIDLPYPLARDVDSRPQPGRTSAADYTAFLKAEVERVLRASGAQQVVLVGNSRGGYPIRNYIQFGGGDRTVSDAVLCGVPDHGVWMSMPGLPDGSEFAGVGPMLRALNQPKDAAGDEVTGPVRWLTIRSDSNDKYAQPDGRWLGKPGQPTGITYEGPALKGAVNVVLPRVDHRETAFSPAAFDMMFRYLAGRPPATLDFVPEARVLLGGKVSGLGLSSTDPASGNYANNLPLPGVVLRIHAVAADTGLPLRDAPVYEKTIAADGRWGPFESAPGAHHEFVLAAPGYATTHVYRSPFPRSSELVNLRPERVPAPSGAASLVILKRPRGYLDPGRDRMSFDGQSPPPGVLPGAGVDSSRVQPKEMRTVVAEFNGERIAGRSWPLAEGNVSVIELTS